MERRQRRPRTEYLLPQLRLYIRYPNAIEHAANLPAGSAQCPYGNAERRYDKRLSQRCAGHKSNGEYTHRQAGGSRRHAHNHILLHPKRQPARRNRHAHRNRHADGDGDANRDGYAYSDVDLHCHRDGNSDIDIYAHRHGHAYRHGYGNRHRYGNGHGNRNADGYTYRYAHCHRDGYTYIDRNRHTNAHRYTNANSYA